MVINGGELTLLFGEGPTLGALNVYGGTISGGYWWGTPTLVLNGGASTIDASSDATGLSIALENGATLNDAGQSTVDNVTVAPAAR